MPADAEPFLLRPRDPLIVRDARPFAAEPGARAVSLPWPLPGTVAGALRGGVAPGLGLGWSEAVTNIALTGYLRVSRRTAGDRWTVYFPAPRDAVPYTDPMDNVPKLMRLRPFAANALPKGTGYTSPDGGESFSLLKIGDDVKPDGGLDDWSFAQVVRWLASPDSIDRPAPPDVLPRVPTETRTHVKIDYGRGTADPGFLFSTEGLAFAPAPGPAGPETAILCRIGLPDGSGWSPAPVFLPLGGERRQTMLEPLAGEFAPEPDPFAAPASLKEAVARSAAAAGGRLRLTLATPALFDAGWLPGGLVGSGTLSTVLAGARLTLVGAAVERRLPVSGWDIAKKVAKPLRYAVPAGSVYFFQLDRPLTVADVEALWMRPVSDREQDRTDGYGLALPGIWDPAPAEPEM